MNMYDEIIIPSSRKVDDFPDVSHMYGEVNDKKSEELRKLHAVSREVVHTVFPALAVLELWFYKIVLYRCLSEIFGS